MSLGRRLAALAVAGPLLFGCSKDGPASAPNSLSAPVSAALPGASGDPGIDAMLRRSLNATVTDLERFHSAPHYRLTLELDWGLFTYSGTQALHYTNRETVALTELNFLLYPNSAEVAGAGTKHLLVKNVQVAGQAVAAEQTGDRLRVPLAAPLAPGAALDLTLDFKGVIHRQAPGASDMQKQALDQVMQLVLGESHAEGGFGVFSYGNGIVSLGLWHPILAAHDERGWDLDHNGGVGDVSYFDVANYELTVTAPKSVHVATSGVEVESRDAGDIRTTRYAAGAVREVAVMASEQFATRTATVNGVTIRSWFLAGHSKAGEAVLGYAKEALALYDRLFGPYPYPELDVVEAPLVGGAGGVEFPGLVTIGSMFYAEDAPAAGDPIAAALASSSYLRDTLEFVVAHEVAHEWWNATVGSDSKRHPFVDEALANHSAILYFENVHGPAAAAAQTELQLQLPYQIARMVGAKDRPVDLPTAEFDGMMEYAAVVYGKGALFFGEMRKELGDDRYFRFLRGYYERFAFDVATNDDLIGGLIKASPNQDRTVALVNRWLEQTHGDEDIGDIRLASIAKLLGGDAIPAELDTLLTLFDRKGTAEVGKLVRQLIDPDGTPKEDVDWVAIAQLAQDILGGDDGGILAQLAGTIAKNPGVLQGDPTAILKAAATTIAGDDPTTVAVIEAAGTLIQLLASDDF